jgi:GxxExxY protein
MQRTVKDLKYKEFTELIIDAFYDVYNSLGYGFLEKVYEKALAFELQTRGLNVRQQFPVSVLYKRRVVGEFLKSV